MFQVHVSGLKGGHSGLDIHWGRGNAIRILSRILLQASTDRGLRIAGLSGGTPVHNAIPREASAVVAVPADQEAAFLSDCRAFSAALKTELAGADPEVTIEAAEEGSLTPVFDEKTQKALLQSLHGCISGVLRMSDDIPGLVETSSNISHVETKDGKVNLQHAAKLRGLEPG